MQGVTKAVVLFTLYHIILCVHQRASKSWFDILVAEAIPLEPVSWSVVSPPGYVVLSHRM